jgi:hypothetical protein
MAKHAALVREMRILISRFRFGLLRGCGDCAASFLDRFGAGAKSLVHRRQLPGKGDRLAVEPELQTVLRDVVY